MCSTDLHTVKDAVAEETYKVDIKTAAEMAQAFATHYKDTSPRAVQALMEHPKQAEFARYANRLLKSVDRSWEYEKGSGRFLTLMKPINRNMGHNFYPGEALLTWSIVYQRDPSKKLLEDTAILGTTMLYCCWPAWSYL